MSRKRITLEVDDVQLFGAMTKMNNNYAPLAERLAGVLLTNPSLIDRIGLSVYGIMIVDIQNVKPEVTT